MRVLIVGASGYVGGRLVALLAALPLLLPLGPVWLSGVAGTAALLWYEHRLVRPDDLSRVNQAFFTVNGCVSFLILLTTALDLALQTTDTRPTGRLLLSGLSKPVRDYEPLPGVSEELQRIAGIGNAYSDEVLHAALAQVRALNAAGYRTPLEIPIRAGGREAAGDRALGR